jgi:hypothetical protein
MIEIIKEWINKVLGPKYKPSNQWHFPVTENFEPRKAELKTKKDIWPTDFKAKDVKKALDKQAPKPTLQKATTRSKTMPLVKSASKKAVSKNIKTEMEIGGKPQKQAVAIALNVQREAKKTTKKGKK